MILSIKKVKFSGRHYFFSIHLKTEKELKVLLCPKTTNQPKTCIVILLDSIFLSVQDFVIQFKSLSCPFSQGPTPGGLSAHGIWARGPWGQAVLCFPIAAVNVASPHLDFRGQPLDPLHPAEVGVPRKTFSLGPDKISVRLTGFRSSAVHLRSIALSQQLMVLSSLTVVDSGLLYKTDSLLEQHPQTYVHFLLW